MSATAGTRQAGHGDTAGQMEARAAQFLAHSAERRRAALGATEALSLDERLARAEASRVAALSHKAAAAGADVRHALEVAAGAATAADAARSAAETQLQQKLRLAEERRSTRMFRKRERGTTECSRAKAVAERMRLSSAATTSAARRHLESRLLRAERRRAAALAARTRSAHVGNARVEIAAWRRRRLTVSDTSASDSSDAEDVSDAAMSPARADTGAGAGAGAGAGSGYEASPVSSASSDDFGFGTSPPRRRRRHNFGFGSDDDGSVPRAWYEAAASPKRSPRRAWREAQRRLERAEERRVERQAAKAERTRRRERTAAARVADNLATQAAARAQARHRLLAALDAATQRREVALAGVVRRVRTHSEDVAERAARVRGAKAVISAMIKRRHRRSKNKPAGATLPAPAAATPPAAPVSDAAPPAAPAVPERTSAADAKARAVMALVRGKTVMSMLRTLHSVVQRSSPAFGSTTGAGAGAGAGADTKNGRFTFTRCSRIMQQKKVVLAFRGLAALVIKATEELLGVPEASHRVSARPVVQRSAKTLMAAVMIAHYPEEMFDEAALQDRESVEACLVQAAHAVVGAMRVVGAVSHKDSTPSPAVVVTALQMFHRAWLTYMDKFAAWKAKDGAVLAAQMGPGFVQLELTRRMYAAQLDDLRREVEAAGGDGTSEQLEATQQLLAGVGSHMAVMRRQLVNLLGEEGALEWERDAVRRLDEELGDEPLPQPPRVTFRNASNAGKRKLSADSTDSTDSSGSSGSSGGRPRVAPSSTLSSDDAASSPPRRVRTRTRRQGDGRMMRNLMSNVALVHRLVLDPGYRFTTVDRPNCLSLEGWTSGPGECTCAATAGADQASLVRCAKHWEHKYSGAADRDELTNLVVAELRVVRTDLAKLTPNRKDLAEELTSTLDLQYLADNLRADTYSADAFATLVSFLASRIAQLEAPARSESTHQWAGAACDAIRAAGSGGSGPSLTQQLALVTAWLHFKLAQIRVDIMNFQLSTLAPFLSSDGRGSEYERKKFEEARGRGELTMAGTALWLRDTAAAAVERAGGATSAAGKALLADLRVNSRESRLRLLVDGVEALLSRPVSLVTQAAAASAGAKATADSYFPETMRLDAEALTAMQNTLQRVALSASLMATVKQVLAAARAAAAGSATASSASTPAVPTSGPSTVEELEAALDDWLRADDMNLADLQEGVVGAAQRIAQATTPLSTDQVAMLKRGVEQAVSTSHPVFATFHARALRVVRDRLCARLAIDATGGASSSTSAVASRSLASALPELHEMADQLSRVVTHNEKVFSGHYSALLSGISTQLSQSGGAKASGAGAGAGAGSGAART